MGKHYDRTINNLNELKSILKEGIQTMTGNDRMEFVLVTIANALTDIDINLAAIADALEEKKDDKA